MPMSRCPPRLMNKRFSYLLDYSSHSLFGNHSFSFFSSKYYFKIIFFNSIRQAPAIGGSFYQQQTNSYITISSATLQILFMAPTHAI